MDWTQIADKLLWAAQHHAWWLLIAWALMGATSFARWAIPHLHGGAGDAVNSERGAWLTAFALAFGGALASGALSSSGFTAAVWMAAVKVALGASGGYAGLRRVLPARAYGVLSTLWLGNLVPALPALDRVPTTPDGRVPPGSTRGLLPIAALSLLSLSCTAAQGQVIKQEILTFISCDLPAAAQDLLPVALAEIASALSGSKLDQAAVQQGERKFGTDTEMCAIKEAENIASSAGATRVAVKPDVVAQLRAHPNEVAANAARCYAWHSVVFVTPPQHASSKEPAVRDLAGPLIDSGPHWCRFVPAIDEEGEDTAQLVCDDDLVPAAEPRRQPRRAPPEGVREARLRWRWWGPGWARA